MRLFLTLVLLLSVFSVVDGKRKKKEKPKLPPIPAGNMRITAEITVKCALYKKFTIQIQMKELDPLSEDDYLGKLWTFRIKKNKGKNIFIWGDTEEYDGLWVDNKLEVFYKIEHNCTPDRTNAKVDAPLKGGFDMGSLSRVTPFDVYFKVNTTYQLPSGPPDYKVWNLEQRIFQRN